MNTFEVIKGRRSVKYYDPEFTLTAEEEQMIFQAAIDAPSSFNIQNWRFVKVEDKELRKKIKAASWDQAQVTDASLLVILCGDLNAWNRNPERYWRNTDSSVKEIILPAIDGFYREKAEVQRDEAMRSCSFAAQNMMLMAKELGYDSCPMIGFEADKVAELIKLPEDHVISMMLVIGKGTKPAWPKPGQLDLDEVIIKDHF